MPFPINRFRAMLVALPFFAAPPVLGAEPPVTPAAPEAAESLAKKTDDGWIRLRRTKNRELRLQVASRDFVPADGKPGPKISLVSAVHIADKPFYDEMQKELDATDVVLFEGVGPPGLGTEKIKRSSAKAERTKNRLRIVGELLTSVNKRDGRYPASLDELAKKIGPSTTKEHWLTIARRDAWDHELAYRPAPDGSSFELLSFGADGEEGGDGKNADMPVDKSELGKWKDQGIQKKLAETFELTFQTDGISTDGPNWRNSDLGMDEVASRLGGDPNAPDDGTPGKPTILDMLNPDSGIAKIGNLVLGFIKLIPGGSDRGKLMMMLILPHAEEALNGGMGPLGAALDMERTMKVIIEDRNQKVVDDLEAIIEQAREHPEHAPKTVAVFYGGGHMPDMEERLTDQLGYKRAGESWKNAIRLDLEKAQITDDEVRTLGRAMKDQLEMLRGMSR